MKRTFLYILTFCVSSLHAQNHVSYPHVVPMTPEAASFALYTDYPVTHYTGVPNISIPLYEIDVDGFKLPITLNYHASGIRVDQEASWVGLGWNLNVGSRISRTIKSVDDFMEDGADRYNPTCMKGYYDAPEISYNLDNHYQKVGDPCCPEGVFACLKHVLQYDPEPDIFYYNLPDMSGKFIIDKSRGAVLFDKSHNLKINIVRGPVNAAAFNIIDADGNQYFYNDKEKTKYYAANNALYRNTKTTTTKYDDRPDNFTEWTPYGLYCVQEMEQGPVAPYNTTSCWCLSKITTKNGRNIIFTYEDDYQELPTQESSEVYNQLSSSGAPLGSGQFFYKSKVVNNGKRLTRIESDFGYINFTSSIRDDIRRDNNKYSQKLDRITIYDKANNLIKSFRFDYSYFNNDYSGDSQYAHVFKRLRLNKVTEYSSNQTTSNQGYNFQYYEGTFPAKNSKDVDYWGFQNGKQYGEKYCIGLYLWGNRKYDGAEKNANFDKAVIGTLKEILYPTGGKTEFQYESNTFYGYYFRNRVPDQDSRKTVYLTVYNEVQSSYPTNAIHRFTLDRKAELTIRCDLENQTGQCDPNYTYYNSIYNPLGQLRRIGNGARTYITYECPCVFGGTCRGMAGEGWEISLQARSFELEAGEYEFEAYKPPITVTASWGLDVNFLAPPVSKGDPVPAPMPGGGIRIKQITTDAKIRKFNYPEGTILVDPVLYYFGTRIGIPFNRNCVIQVSESKTPLSTFNNGNFVGYNWVEEYMTAGAETIKTKYYFYNDPEELLDDNEYKTIFSPVVINYKNGLIRRVEDYSNSTIVKTIDYAYESTYSQEVMAFIDRGKRRSEDDLLFYKYKVEYPLKGRETATFKNQVGGDIVTQTDYTYNSRNLLQTSTLSLNGYSMKDKYKYPFDFGDLINVKLVAKNMIGMPVEVLNLKDDKVISGKKTEYQDISGILLPKEVSTINTVIPLTESSSPNYYNPELYYDTYISYGKPVQVRKADMAICYLWSYNYQYPIAEIKNATYNQVKSALGYSSDSQIESLAAQANPNVVNISDSLRTNLPNAFVTTYTYKPLVGILTATDPRGVVTNYEYDDFGRLKKVTQAGKVIESYDYHYKD